MNLRTLDTIETSPKGGSRIAGGRCFVAVVAALAGFILNAPAALAEQGANAAPVKAAFVYQPPDLGLPKVRVGGASRGAGDAKLDVQVLAPEHTGRTLEAQPVLFWYLSQRTGARFEFTLMDETSIDPLAEATLEPAPRAGINRIDLAALGIELEPGVEYQWSVAAVLDEAQRSRDVVAVGRIVRIDDVPAIGAAGDERARVAELARAGVWYDAIAALNARIDRSPGDTALVEGRSQLLEQVGLDIR